MDVVMFRSIWMCIGVIALDLDLILVFSFFVYALLWVLWQLMAHYELNRVWGRSKRQNPRIRKNLFFLNHQTNSSNSLCLERKKKKSLSTIVLTCTVNFIWTGFVSLTHNLNENFDLKVVLIWNILIEDREGEK